MHYLNDFLESLFHCLPAKVSEHLTEIQETDERIRDNTAEVEKSVEGFFSSKDMSAAGKAAEFKKISKSFDELLKDADWKIHHSKELHTLVKKYLKHLDSELYKFKMELEVDNAGITQILENKVSSSSGVLSLPPLSPSAVRIKKERKR